MVSWAPGVALAAVGALVDPSGSRMEEAEEDHQRSLVGASEEEGLSCLEAFLQQTKFTTVSLVTNQNTPQTKISIKMTRLE